METAIKIITDKNTSREDEQTFLLRSSESAYQFGLERDRIEHDVKHSKVEDCFFIDESSSGSIRFSAFTRKGGTVPNKIEFFLPAEAKLPVLLELRRVVNYLITQATKQ